VPSGLTAVLVATSHSGWSVSMRCCSVVSRSRSAVLWVSSSAQRDRDAGVAGAASGRRRTRISGRRDRRAESRASAGRSDPRTRGAAAVVMRRTRTFLRRPPSRCCSAGWLCSWRASRCTRQDGWRSIRGRRVRSRTWFWSARSAGSRPRVRTQAPAVATVSLYAYVNPIIAVILGILILREPFDARMGLPPR